MSHASGLTRPAYRHCGGCHHSRPVGSFNESVPAPGRVDRFTQIEHDQCRECRQNRRTLPGRGFR